MHGQRLVMLDRDGTINVEQHYLSDPEQVELVANAAAGLRELKQMGLGLVVVTNQSGIARRYFDEKRLDQVHQRLRRLLSAEGVELDGIYVCPHRPEDRCRCRKPLPGLLEQAACDFDVRPEETFVVGDKPCDIDLGRSVGATTFLVRTGYGAIIEQDRAAQPDYVVNDLTEMAKIIRQILGGEPSALPHSAADVSSLGEDTALNEHPPEVEKTFLTPNSQGPHMTPESWEGHIQ